MAITTLNEGSAVILVTGATGRSAATSSLSSRRRVGGYAPWCVPKPPAAGKSGPGVEFVVGDVDQPETLDAALLGVERLYPLTPLALQLRERDGAVVAAARCR
jgi:uncharacterized protein YbjT (DUF2867 family)